MADSRLAEGGLRFPRRSTRLGEDGSQGIQWQRRDVRIHGADGQEVFRMDGVEVPATWSDLAAQILASKYLRRTGVPAQVASGVPAQGPSEVPAQGPSGAGRAGGTGGETSARQVVGRIVHAIRAAGSAQGYFASPEDAEAFAAELTHLLLHQKAAFNSPVWFNVGLHEAYGIRAPRSHFVWRGKAVRADAYEHPQASACFIQSVRDNLVGERGIFDLLRREAQLFKYGSGTGTNFSPLRSRHEPLSGGGTSSGLMSFLKVFDAAAGATKSGGTTRRAAKMVCLDADHPEILDFIDWKVDEERKAQALIAHGHTAEWESGAYASVSGQNANNSVRLTDAFMQAVEGDGAWPTRYRGGGVHETLRARAVWQRIAHAAWTCADPGVQFHDTIQRWHTCKASGPIHASNPCSEYMFLDDSACNLASLDLLAFWDGRFDVEAFQHAVRVLFVAQDILVGHAGYPTPRIARNSFRFRPLGLGYADLGALCMVNGVPYDSAEGRGIAAAVTSLMTGTAYAASAEMAQALGAFEGIDDERGGVSNRQHMADVLDMHREHAVRLVGSGTPMAGLDAQVPPPWAPVAHAALEAWQKACDARSWRNAQATVVAPTGTIALLMDCDTTGIEPDFSLVKTKHMAGGGVVRIINRSALRALHGLGYGEEAAQAIARHALGTGRLEGAVDDVLRARGFSDSDIEQARKSVARTGRFGDGTPGVSPARLRAAGFGQDEVDAIVHHVEGHHHFEGSALRPEHLAVFDCAGTSGDGTRSIAPSGHVEMMAAVQPFLSGAISKTVNLPRAATEEDVRQVFWSAWRLGLKAVAIYRDGSKASQPLAAGRQAAGQAIDADSPPCPECAHATVRSGSCFRCENCGTSIGCS